MKLFSTTYDDKERTKEINALVGNRFGFISSLKMGGTGSSKMMMNATSPNFEMMLNPITNVNYCSLEIRPRGIIAHMNQSGLKSWCWVIPFYKLVIYKSNGLQIHSDGEFVAYKDDKRLAKNLNFIQKILKFKVEYIENHSV